METKKRKNSPEYQNFVKTVAEPLIEKASQILKVKLDSSSIQTLSDTFHCLICHNKSFPSGIDLSLANQFISADNWETNYYYNSTYISALSFSTLYQVFLFFLFFFFFIFIFNYFFIFIFLIFFYFFFFF